MWPMTRWLVAGFLCLGAFLRIYHFWTPDLWIDEYVTWFAVAPGDWAEAVRRLTAAGFYNTPPSYYLITKLSTDLLGAGAFSLRLPSIVFGIGALALVYPLGLRLFQDRHAALLALAVFAVNQELIWYSQNARPYALALFCTMLSFLCYLSLLQTEKVSYRIGYVLATVGVYYTHYLFGFVVVIQLLHLCLTRGWSWVTARRWPLTFLLLALLCLPGVVQLLGLFRQREVLDYIPARGLGYAVKLALRFLEPRAFPVAALVLLAIGFREIRKDLLQGHPRLGLLLLWFLAPILGFWLVPPLFGMTLLSARYVLFAAPAALFLIAWVLARGNRTGWRQWAPLGVFVALTFAWNLLPPLQASGTFSKWGRGDWAQAAQLLARSARADDLIFLRTGFSDADLFARSNPDPLRMSLSMWPVTAHLASEHAYQLVNLPAHDNAETRPYLDALVTRAAAHRRVWIIGKGRMVPAMVRALVTDAHFQVAQRLSYGIVRVVVLDQDGSQSDRLRGE